MFKYIPLSSFCKRTVSSFSLTTHLLLGDLGTLDVLERRYHLCFLEHRLVQRVPSLLWVLCLRVCLGRLNRPSSLADPWVLWVHDCQVILQHLLVPWVQGFPKCLEYLLRRHIMSDHKTFVEEWPKKKQ